MLVPCTLLLGFIWEVHHLLFRTKWQKAFQVVAACNIGAIYRKLRTHNRMIIENVDVNHLPLDKMATILADDNFKCIFLNENYRIPIRIHWNLFTGVQLTISQHCFRWWLAAEQLKKNPYKMMFTYTIVHNVIKTIQNTENQRENVMKYSAHDPSINTFILSWLPLMVVLHVF